VPADAGFCAVSEGPETLFVWTRHRKEHVNQAVDEHRIPGMERVDELAQCLVELIFIRLCNIRRSPKKQRKESLSRWELILRDYRRIRQLMSETTLQLVEVNQRTLTTWHNERLKGQEVSVLLQGLELPEARPVALDASPVA